MVKKKSTVSTKRVGKAKRVGKVVKKENEKSKKDTRYEIILSVNDTKQTSKGDTILEAINKLEFPVSLATPMLFTFITKTNRLGVQIPVQNARKFCVLESMRELMCDSWERQINE